MYQGSDRAELRAGLHAMERHTEGKLWIKTDNTSVADGIARWKNYLRGEGSKPKFGPNAGLWKRIEKEIERLGWSNVQCTWTKGHATDDLVDRGLVAKDDKDGNDKADDLAVRGRKAHGSEVTKSEEADLRRRVAMITQKMAIRLLIKRQALRRKKEMEDEEERIDLYGEAKPDMEDHFKVAPQSQGIDTLFPPTEAKDGETQNVTKLKERFPNGIWKNPGEGDKSFALGPTPTNLSDGRTRWRYPKAWIPPLKWYWSNVTFLRKDNDESKKGISWIEMAMDFEISTRVMLTGSNVTRAKAKNKQGASESKGEDTVTQRAYNFAAASRRVLQICGEKALPQATSILTLLPFGWRPVAGLPSRPILLNPEAVFEELAIQSLTYNKAFESGAPTAQQWKWQPRYVGLPKQARHAKPTQVVIGLHKTRRRIRGKRSCDELAPEANLQDDVRQSKRRRISTKTPPDDIA